MAGIGELAVFVTANTGKAQKSLKGFRGQVQKTARAVRKGARDFNKFTGMDLVTPFTSSAAAIAATTAAVYSLGSAVLSTMDDLDSLAKTSDKLGVDPRKLAGIRHAAEQTGVSINTVDMALQRMLRRVSEAAVGKGEARGALAELGLDAQFLNQMQPDVALGKVAEAINKVGNQSDKLRLAMKLFDSEGVAMVNTLKLGEDGLAKLVNEAKELRIAPTREELAMIEAANDAMDRTAKTLKGVLVDISVAFADTIEKTADKISDTAKKASAAKRAAEQSVPGGMLRGAFLSDQNKAITMRALDPTGSALLLGAAYDMTMRTGEQQLAAEAVAEKFDNTFGNITGIADKYAGSFLRGAENAAKFSDGIKNFVDDTRTSGDKLRGYVDRLGESIVKITGVLENEIAGAAQLQVDWAGEMQLWEDQARASRNRQKILGIGLNKGLESIKPPYTGGRAALQSARAGTREEYAIRANMKNESLQVQTQQLEVLNNIETLIQQDVTNAEKFIDSFDADGNQVSIIGI